MKRFLVGLLILLVGCSEGVPDFQKLSQSSTQILYIADSSTSVVTSFQDSISLMGSCPEDLVDIMVKTDKVNWITASQADPNGDLNCQGDGKFNIKLPSSVTEQIFSGLASETVTLQIFAVLKNHQDNLSFWSVSFAPDTAIVAPDPGQGTNNGVNWNPGTSRLEIANTTNPNSLDNLGATVSLSGLQAYWKFDEANINESLFPTVSEQINSINGSITTGEFSANKIRSGHLGNSLYFDGVDDYVQVASDSRLEITGAITLAAWIKPEVCCATGGSRIISKRRTAAGSDVYSLHLSDVGGFYKLSFRITDSTSETTTIDTLTEINLNEWQFVVGTYDGSKMNLYLNGVKDPAEGLLSKTIETSTSPVHLGMRAEEARHFKGHIDEASIWNRALDPSEVQTIYKKQAALATGEYLSQVVDGGAILNWNEISWVPEQPAGKPLPIGTESLYGNANANMNDLKFLMRFDEWTSGTVNGGYDFKDYSGLSQHGSAEGSPLFNHKGRFNNAISLDGVDDCVNLGNMDHPWNGLTVSAWIFPELNGGFHKRIISKSFDTTNDSHIFMLTLYPLSGGAGLRARLKTGAPASATTVLPPTSELIKMNQWNHVAMSYNGSFLKTYVNGKLDSSTSKFGAVSSDSLRPVRIGCSADGVDFFKGQIDEVAIWGRGLGANEILALYQRGATDIKFQLRTCSDPSCSTGGEFAGPSGVSSYFSEEKNFSSGLPKILFDPSLYPANRYIQYKVLMESFSTVPPKLISVELKGTP